MVLRWMILREIWQELPQELQDATIYLNWVGETPPGTESRHARVAMVREAYAPNELRSSSNFPDPWRSDGPSVHRNNAGAAGLQDPSAVSPPRLGPLSAGHSPSYFTSSSWGSSE